MLILRHFEHFFDRIDPTGVIYCYLHFMEGLAWCIFFAWCLSSCTRTVYQDREVVRHDSIYVTALAVDTILQRDSIHVLERGDTVRITEFKYIYKVKERTDTFFRDRVDTFLMKKNIVKYKTKTVKKKDWEFIFISFFLGLILGVLSLPIFNFFENRERAQTCSDLPPLPERDT